MPKAPLLNSSSASAVRIDDLAKRRRVKSGHPPSDGCVDTYVYHPEDRHILGLPAQPSREVAKRAATMKEFGVDLTGLMTGLADEGTAAGQIPAEIESRLRSLMGAAGGTPTLTEGMAAALATRGLWQRASHRAREHIYTTRRTISTPSESSRPGP